MKKQLLFSTLAAIMLSACGGGSNQNAGGENKAAADTITAFQIFKMINPDMAAESTNADSSDRMYYLLYNEEDLSGISTLLLRHNDNGYLVVTEKSSHDEMGDVYIDYLKFYHYNDGKLTELKDIQPTPSINEFAAIDAVAFYDPDDEGDFGPAGIIYNYNFVDQLLEVSASPFWVDPFYLYYKWDGSKFVLDHKSDLPKHINLITSAGLGNIYVGDNPPEKLEGFQANTLGKTMYFNRDGKKMFKLSLNADGKIDTITILSDLYTYRMDVDGPSKTPLGIGFNPIDYGFWGKQYFKFKDNNWVRTIPAIADENLEEATQKNDSLGVIEFYTTNNGITNLYPEIGKVVTNDDRPDFNSNATITLIKIYKAQPEIDTGLDIFHQLIKLHAKENDDNPLLNYDEQADEIYKDNKKTNGFHLNDYGSHQVYNHAFKYFPLKSGGYKVYEYVAWEHGYQYNCEVNPFDEEFHLYCYIYKDGTLTPTALEPDIPSDLHSTPTPLTDNGLKGIGYTFVWDGESMVKQEE